MTEDWLHSAIKPALATLGEELFEARQLYDRTLDDGSNGRPGAAASLAAVLTFLRALPGVRELGLDLPLGMLARALVDLDRGAVEPILRAAATGSRPVRVDVELLRSYAAAAAELLCQGGIKRSEACEQVATRLDSEGFRRDAKGNRITAATVLAWRKAAREAAASDPVRIRYEKIIRPENVIDPKRAAEEVLVMLAPYRPPSQGK